MGHDGLRKRLLWFKKAVSVCFRLFTVCFRVTNVMAGLGAQKSLAATGFNDWNTDTHG